MMSFFMPASVAAAMSSTRQGLTHERRRDGSARSQASEAASSDC